MHGKHYNIQKQMFKRKNKIGPKTKHDGRHSGDKPLPLPSGPGSVADTGSVRLQTAPTQFPSAVSQSSIFGRRLS